ncbi:class I histocompatibility antigen, F10 alpha chain-like [Engraulis encrasicolus]|uniref:class I histocompatibility antigen, F10 alpha chain-like n=1 Tax=Engraulis encrasicolus TaxID=184585 RepID=UPI002FD5F1A5
MGPGTLFVVCAIVSACLADIQLEPERHSLYYVYIALSQPVSAPGIFEFTAMGLLDDRKMDYYNSTAQVKIPEQDWMRERLPADYWEKGTQSRKSKQKWFKVNIDIVMERMRHNASDVHSLMWRHGCEAVRTADGSLQFVKGVDEYSYDGMDFLSFDNDEMQWVAPVNEALQTKRKWDDMPILNQYTKGYLEKECVQWLDKFRTYGDKELTESQKQHPPKVHLFARNGRPHGRYQLACLATGFYPKDIKISILKNDWPEKQGHPDDVLPNGDGTHQIRVTIMAEKDEIHMHRCKVENRILPEPIIVEWEAGFYPKDIKISILKNDWPEKDGHERDVLPYGDGTHQIRVTTIAEKEEIHMHRCKVEHRTLDKPIIVEWDKERKLFEDPGPVSDSGPPIGPIAGGVITLLLIAAGLVIFLAKMRKKLCFVGVRDLHSRGSPAGPNAKQCGAEQILKAHCGCGREGERTVRVAGGNGDERQSRELKTCFKM